MSNGTAQDGDAKEMDHIKRLINKMFSTINLLSIVLILLLISAVVLFCIAVTVVEAGETLPTLAPDPEEWAVTLTLAAKDHTPKKTPTPTKEIIYWTSTPTPNPYPTPESSFIFRDWLIQILLR